MSEIDLKDDQMEAINSFLSDCRILIVDPSKSCRSSITKTLLEMGAKLSNVYTARSYQEAEQLIEVQSIQFIITDYLISRHCSLYLLKKFTEINPNPEKRLFILVTGNSQESTVAEAAEEDVDAFICKPFTGGTLKNYLAESIHRKIEPLRYQKLVNEGKRHLAEENFPGAQESFREAKEEDEKPSLACYYLGKTEELLEDFETAKREFEEGLSHKSIHYKCLVGKFELLTKMGLEIEAFHTVQTLAQHFPISPQRLGKVFELAVYTYHFEEMDNYYELFLSLPHRSETLKKTVAASLVVAGKYLLRQGEQTRAVRTFRCAANANPTAANVLREIIFTLVEYEIFEDAGQFLSKFPEDCRQSEDYKILKFLVDSGGDATLSIVNDGRKLISDGIVHPEVLRVMIRRYREFDKPQAAEDLAYKAIRYFPELKEEFLKIIGQNSA